MNVLISPIHLTDFVKLRRARPNRLAATVPFENPLIERVKVKIRIDAEREPVLECIDAPDVHGVVDGLNPFLQCLPNLAVVAANLEAPVLKLPEADFHVEEVALAKQLGFVTDSVHLREVRPQEGMFVEHLEDLVDLRDEVLA